MAYGRLPHLWCAGEAYRYYEPDLREAACQQELEAFLAHRDQITDLI